MLKSASFIRHLVYSPSLCRLMTQKLFAFARGQCCQENPDSPMNHETLLPGHLYLSVLKVTSLATKLE